MKANLFLIFFLVCTFLWGGIPTGYIVVKLLKGVDIRNQGSGNIGATNVRRVLGTPWFFGVLFLDAFKGALPVLATLLIPSFCNSGRVITAVAVIGGNLFSPWLGFRGGKGIATCLGVFLVLAPIPMFISIALFILTLFVLNHVSIASICAAVFFPVAIVAVESFQGTRHNAILLAFAIVLAVALAIMHRANIARFVRGTESQFFMRKNSFSRGAVFCGNRFFRKGENTMHDLRYPIGQFEAAPPPDAGARAALLSQLAEIPDRLRAAVASLTDSQLDTPYRPDGWTVRQVVHHLADAQMNWYIRTRLALTEDNPTVKPYDENQWAELHDARTAPVEPSLKLLEGIHQRWVDLFHSLSDAQWKASIIHPERGTFALHTTLTLVVWHGRHHTAHIVELRKRMGWRP
jgi:acyl-phosphate glycerol 3-phosphate acyltransferase